MQYPTYWVRTSGSTYGACEGAIVVVVEEKRAGSKLVARGQVVRGREVRYRGGTKLVERQGRVEADALQHVGPVWLGIGLE